MTAVFADTSCRIALTNEADEAYEKGAGLEIVYGAAKIITSEYAEEVCRSSLELCLTDCISMQSMRRERIAEALTSDRHFRAGRFPGVVPALKPRRQSARKVARLQ